jgi:hypothetical protein
MPHTSHKKKKSTNKRQLILDEDGWTKVTSSPSVLKSSGVTKNQPPYDDQPVDAPRVRYTQYDSRETPVAPGATLSKVQQRFEHLNERWSRSQACHSLRHEVEARVKHREELGQAIDNCIVFGTGTMCGVFAGWTERHDVALIQIAVFKTVADTISRLIILPQDFKLMLTQPLPIRYRTNHNAMLKSQSTASSTKNFSVR